MPAYDYRCLTCQTTFERRVAIADADDVRCPDGHTQVKRLLSVFAVGRGGQLAPTAMTAPAPAPSGGCCGGACGCR